MPVFNKTSTICFSARTVSAGVSALALSAALFADVPSAAAADFHFISTGNSTWGQVAGNAGFEGAIPPGAGDRAIYDGKGTGQSVVWGGAKNAGQLVFLAPYDGTGFKPMSPASQSGTFNLNGVDGLGVDSQVNQQITLSERVAIAASQEWRIDSATGRITQLGHTATRFLNLGSYMLTLNAVGAGNAFILNNPVTGTGGLIVKGAGTTFLTNANTYSGGTFLNGGTVEVTADNNLGAASGGLGFDGGTLRFGSSFATARTISLSAGGGTIDTRGNTATLSGGISGAGGLTIVGGGLLNLTGTVGYTGATDIQAGTLALSGTASLANSSVVVANGVFDVSAVAGSTTDIRSLSGGGSVALGTSQLVITNAADIFSGAIHGTGGLTVSGGTQVLTGTNSYTGGTTITAGTLSLGNGGASGSVAGDILNNGTLVFNRADTVSFDGVVSGAGAIRYDGAGTTTMTANSSAFAGSAFVYAGTLSVNGMLGGTMDVLGGRLQGTGTIGNTANHLGGVIAPGNSIGTLTIGGDYTGNGGALEIEAELGGNASPTDLLVITGNSILGSAPTQVRVINVGGAGGLTTGNGIKIVDVGGTSAAGAFVLAGPAIAGAYRYGLFQNGVTTPADGDWYLRSSGLAPTLPTYEIYPQVLLDLVGLPTLKQRAGTRHWAAIDGAAPNATPASAVWTRIEGAHGHSEARASTTNAEFDSDTLRMQAGVDGQLAGSAAGVLIGGLNLQYGRASADIFSDIGAGTNGTSSYGLGAALTWYGGNGLYVDGQGQVSVLRSDFASNEAGSIGEGIHGSGYAVSLEAGRQLAIGNGWSLTPQAQLAYAAISFDSFADPFGAEVSLKDGDSLKGRIGLSTDYRRDADTHVYAIANLTYEFLDGTTATVSGVDLTYKPERFGGEIGLGGAYRWDDGKYALHGEALASTSFAGGYGFKGSIGFTAGL